MCSGNCYSFERKAKPNFGPPRSTTRIGAGDAPALEVGARRRAPFDFQTCSSAPPTARTRASGGIDTAPPNAPGARAQIRPPAAPAQRAEQLAKSTCLLLDGSRSKHRSWRRSRRRCRQRGRRPRRPPPSRAPAPTEQRRRRLSASFRRSFPARAAQIHSSTPALLVRKFGRRRCNGTVDLFLARVEVPFLLRLTCRREGGARPRNQYLIFG